MAYLLARKASEVYYELPRQVMRVPKHVEQDTKRQIPTQYRAHVRITMITSG
jgi:hypothetical protein